MKQLKMMAAFVLVFSILLTACSKGEPKETTEATNAKNGLTENATGRYLEKEYELPQDVGAVFKIKKLSDNTLRLIGYTAVYESSDNGATWEKAAVQPAIYEALAAHESSYLQTASMDENGNMFFIYMNETAETTYLYVDSDNNQKELNITLPELDNTGSSRAIVIDDMDTENANADEDQDEDSQTETEAVENNTSISNFLMEVKFTQDGKLLGKDIKNSIYLIDPSTGEINYTFEDEAYIYGGNFASVGNRLLISHQKGVDIYDLTNGQLLDPETALNDYFSSGDESNGSVNTGTFFSSGISSLLMIPSGDDTVYFCDRSGLYRYTLGTSAVESVINGALTSMSNQEYYFQDMVWQEDDTFLIAYMDMNNNLKLMHYEYSDQAATVPAKELTIYSLKDNQNIRQAISKFQSDHQDIYVNFEIGMSGEDAATVSDAVTALNTRIMAGNGPDIIVLDGMPVDSYTEKGLLADLSDTINQTSKDDQLFEKIIYSKQTGDGLYAIPTRFAIPVIYGEKETLSGITSLSSLADTVKSIRESDSEIKSILGTYSPETLTKLLLYTSSPAIMAADGTMNEPALKEFLTQVKSIYDENTAGSGTDGAETLISDTGLTETLVYMLSEYQKLGIGNVSKITDLNILFSALEEKDLDYRLLDTLSNHVYIPMDTVGINAKSEMMEESKAFVKALLSKDFQKVDLSGGFPVNLTAYEENCQESIASVDQLAAVLSYDIEDDEGNITSSDSLYIRPGTEQEYEAFKESYLSLETAAVTNDIIIDAIAQGAAKCLSGSSSVEDAVSSIMQSVNLYLSE